MTTYTEREGKEPFDWNSFLDRAISGDADIVENDLAKLYAKHWVTCACGNTCESIPRDSIGAPFDPKLRSLGLGFNSAITFGYYENAKETLKRIEKRSAQILWEMEIEDNTLTPSPSHPITQPGKEDNHET
jgi:hypothetical protein